MRDLETNNYRLATGTGAGRGTFIIIRRYDDATTDRETGIEADEAFNRFERAFNISGSSFDKLCARETYTKEVTNLDRAMAAETTLLAYSDAKEGNSGGDLYDVGESAAIDLICDLCHLLHLDEKTAGCKTEAEIENMLKMAFQHFQSEIAEEAHA